jgi:uncharacterized FlaG/YvyC family protein
VGPPSAPSKTQKKAAAKAAKRAAEAQAGKSEGKKEKDDDKKVKEGLARMVGQIEAAGGSATGTLLNALHTCCC